MIEHTEIDRNFIKKKLEIEIIYFSFVRCRLQICDVLTKEVTNMIFNESLLKLKMCDIIYSKDVKIN